MKDRVLACTCGDCTHWELITQSGDRHHPKTQSLKCMTCGHRFKATVRLSKHAKLKNVEREG